MLENGPECICEPEYERYEDGQCLKPETGNPTDGECDTNGTGLYWTTWFNTDTPAGEGDWEMLRNLDGSDVCANPRAIEAQRVDGNTDPLVTHISKETGFWCLNADNTVACADFQVRFCCPKFQDGSDCSEPDYEWY